MAIGFEELGYRIGKARRNLGMTQQECALTAGMGRTVLAKIETGARRVQAMELARLATALDMRIEWFFEDAPPAVVSRRGTAEPGVLPTILDRTVERLAREVTFLGSILDEFDLRATPELPVPSSPSAAEAAADEVRGLLGYKDGEPAIDLVESAAEIGLLIFSLGCGTADADGASVLLDRGGVAVVNGERDLGRRRLTAAHEIGHYVFADEYSTDWNVLDHSAPRTEALIDRFARALLLPSAALAGRWRGGEDTRTDAVLIGHYFRVDMSTLAQRLDELELASPADMATVRATRIRKSDIVEHDLFVPNEMNPPDFPRVYVNAVLDAYRAREISAARACSLLPETWGEDDLPELPMLPPDAIWSFVS